MERTSRILIFDPNPNDATIFRERLEAKHHWVVSISDAANLKELLAKQHFHLCIGAVESMAAVDVLRETRQLRPETTWIATGSETAVSFVVECIRAGASNYFAKSRELEEFDKIVAETLARTSPPSLLESEIDFPFPQFVGRHPKVLEIFQLIMSIKDTDSTVLITGESGTGKEVVARAIHALSPRKKYAMVAVNCGAIPANLLESELFGHMKGAFTGAIQNRTGRFQLAGHGTLFLDEISDLSLDLQAKILRAIQNKTFEPVGSPHSQRLEARIIAATNQDLETAVADKKFRQDLFYRLNVIPIHIPPLRTRKSDIPLLVKAFCDRFNAEHAKPITGISEEAMQCLVQYQWPGNVRELENMMERVIVLKRDAGLIELKDLPLPHFRNVRLDRYVASVALPEEGVDFNQAVNEFENELILQALQKTDGNKNKAATLLNLNRTTLVEKLKRKGLRLVS